MLKKFPPYITYHNFHLPKVKFNWCSPIFSCQRQLGDRYFKHCLYIKSASNSKPDWALSVSRVVSPFQSDWFDCTLYKKGLKLTVPFVSCFRSLSPNSEKMPPATPPYRPPPPPPSRKLSPVAPSQQIVQIHQEIPRSPTSHCAFNMQGHGELKEQPMRRQSRSRSPTRESVREQWRSEPRARRSSQESRSRSPVPFADRNISNSPMPSPVVENISNSPMTSPRSHKRSSGRSVTVARSSPNAPVSITYQLIIF